MPAGRWRSRSTSRSREWGRRRRAQLDVHRVWVEEISEGFKPEIVAGSHWVRLWIEGLNMKAWEYQTKYKIVCE